jgi:hypothetical protein
MEMSQRNFLYSYLTQTKMLFSKTEQEGKSCLGDVTSGKERI